MALRNRARRPWVRSQVNLLVCWGKLPCHLIPGQEHLGMGGSGRGWFRDHCRSARAWRRCEMCCLASGGGARSQRKLWYWHSSLEGRRRRLGVRGGAARAFEHRVGDWLGAYCGSSDGSERGIWGRKLVKASQLLRWHDNPNMEEAEQRQWWPLERRSHSPSFTWARYLFRRLGPRRSNSQHRGRRTISRVPRTARFNQRYRNNQTSQRWKHRPRPKTKHTQNSRQWLSFSVSVPVSVRASPAETQNRVGYPRRGTRSPWRVWNKSCMLGAKEWFWCHCDNGWWWGDQSLGILIAAYLFIIWVGSKYVYSRWFLNRAFC